MARGVFARVSLSYSHFVPFRTSYFIYFILFFFFLEEEETYYILDPVCSPAM